MARALAALVLVLCSHASLYSQPAEQPAPPPDDVPTLPPVRVPGERPTGDVSPFPGTGSLPDSVAVTPTRGESPIREFGGSVTVIPESRIINSEQPYLRDILFTTPGLSVIQNGGPGRASSVFLRGASSRATKVLLDGIPINDPSSPQRAFDFGPFSTLDIERVEVLRGPQSVLYGSDAVGGVINIITKRGQGPTTTWFSGMGGAYETYQASAGASGGTDKFYYSIGLTRFDQEGFNVSNQRYNRAFTVENDPFRQNVVSSRFGWTPNEHFDIDVVLRYIHSDVAVDAFNRPPFEFIEDDPRATGNSSNFYGRIGGRLSLLDGMFEQRVAYNQARTNRESSDPNNFFTPETNLFHAVTQKFEYQANLKFGDWNRFTLGYDYYHEAADNPPTDPVRRTNKDNAIYLQDHLSIADRWFTTAGIRWDDYELAGPATTWRLASIYHVKQTGTAFHGSYGTGFVAPSLSELFTFLPPFAFGNPNLRPERARGYEYGVEQTFFDRKLLFDVTYYRLDFDDQIDFDFNQSTWFNIATSRSTGVEAMMSALLTDSTRLDVNYTNNNATDLDRNRTLPRRPYDRVNVTLNQGLLNGRANWYVQFSTVGVRYDYAVPAPQQRMPTYALVNTAFWYDLTKNVRLFGRIDNVFDADYEEVVGYNTPRFSAYGGIRITLGPR
jgi:vitamin B12 transporter